MQTVAVVISLCISILASSAHAEEFYILDKASNALSRSQGNPQEIKAIEWHIRLYRRGKKTGGDDHWGLITDKTASDARKQLERSQKQQREFENCCGSTMPESSLTYFNPLGPIAIIDSSKGASGHQLSVDQSVEVAKKALELYGKFRAVRAKVAKLEKLIGKTNYFEEEAAIKKGPLIAYMDGLAEAQKRFVSAADHMGFVYQLSQSSLMSELQSVFPQGGHVTGTDRTPLIAELRRLDVAIERENIKLAKVESSLDTENVGSQKKPRNWTRAKECFASTDRICTWETLAIEGDALTVTTRFNSDGKESWKQYGLDLRRAAISGEPKRVSDQDLGDRWEVKIECKNDNECVQKLGGSFVAAKEEFIGNLAGPHGRTSITTHFKTEAAARSFVELVNGEAPKAKPSKERIRLPITLCAQGDGPERCSDFEL